jgi:hypothetical protein
MNDFIWVKLYTFNMEVLKMNWSFIWVWMDFEWKINKWHNLIGFNEFFLNSKRLPSMIKKSSKRQVVKNKNSNRMLPGFPKIESNIPWIHGTLFCIGSFQLIGNVRETRSFLGVVSIFSSQWFFSFVQFQDKKVHETSHNYYWILKSQNI